MILNLLALFIFLNLCCTQDNFYDDKRVFEKQKLNYLVSLPDSYKNITKKTYPLLVFLHGGDRSITKHHPKKYALKAGIEFPFIVIAPHCKGGCSWRNLQIDGLLAEVISLYRVDKKRIYLTGYSMGGAGSWS